MLSTMGRQREKFIVRPRSVVPGRQRWDVSILRRRPRLAALLEVELQSVSGVGSVYANPVTSRLLIHHDKELSKEKVHELVWDAVLLVIRKFMTPLAPQRAATVVPAEAPTVVPAEAQSPQSPQRRPRRSSSLILAGGAVVALAMLRPSPLVGLAAVLGTTAIIFRRAWRKSVRARQDTDSIPGSTRRPLLRIVGPHRRKLCLASALSVFAQIAEMLLVFLVGWSFVVLIQGGNAGLVSLGLLTTSAQLWFLGGAAAVGCVALAGFSYAAGIQWRNLAQTVRHEWRNELYPHVQQLELRYLEDERTTRISTVLTDDVNQLGAFFASSAKDVIQLATSITVLIPAFLIFAPNIAWVAFLPLPIVTWLLFHYHGRAAQDYATIGENGAVLNSQIINNLAANSTIKSFCAEEYEAERIRRLSEEYRDNSNGVDKNTTTYAESVRLCATASIAAVLLLGGRAVLAGALPLVVFNPLVMLPQQAVWRIPRLGDVIDQYQQSVAALRRVLYLRGLPVESDGNDGQQLDVATVRGEILLDGVTFGYPGRPPTLDNLSLRITPGKVTAIVGATGAGKTTIAKLLMRFQHADSGQVLLDGRDIRDLKMRDLRKAICFVAQDAFLFDGSIKDNISYGSFDAECDRVVDASRLAAADGFIQDLPMRYETTIGERGVLLSGGQKQRISLARAIVKSAPIVILDEATSAVDNETEAAIQSALADFAEGRTLVIIAHRLSTIRQADCIYVMDKGGVLAEQGTHDELLERNGIYSSLWRLQVGEGNS
jgi:ATP-binding cassette, subfamily B, bacterial